MTAQCPSCGAPRNAENRFCPRCGAQFSAPSGASEHTVIFRRPPPGQVNLTAPPVVPLQQPAPSPNFWQRRSTRGKTGIFGAGALLVFGAINTVSGAPSTNGGATNPPAAATASPTVQATVQATGTCHARPHAGADGTTDTRPNAGPNTRAHAATDACPASRGHAGADCSAEPACGLRSFVSNRVHCAGASRSRLRRHSLSQVHGPPTRPASVRRRSRRNRL